MSDELLPGLIGRHPSMRSLAERVRRAAAADLPVLIVGESGTGKELIARALHNLSRAGGGPFVDLNCAALPDNLAEAELFGWEEGAFTGARRRTPGLLELADGGTLFLDEACSLPMGVQAKLLRAIELREFRRVGGRQLRRSTFRLVTAFSESSDELQARSRLRLDFAQRVAGIPIEVPPLRDRGCDIDLLASVFLRDANRNGHPAKRLTPAALEVAHRYSWPGNVRELRNVMGRIEVLTDDSAVGPTALVAHLPPVTRPPSTRAEWAELLALHGWDIARVARALRVARSTLYQHIARHGVRRPQSTP